MEIVGRNGAGIDGIGSNFTLLKCACSNGIETAVQIDHSRTKQRIWCKYV